MGEPVIIDPFYVVLIISLGLALLCFALGIAVGAMLCPFTPTSPADDFLADAPGDWPHFPFASRGHRR